jgi:tetratricopeptide (TPR) repeat protein
MMSIARYGVIVFFIGTVYSCGTLSIKSTPTVADIFVTVPGKQEARLIGKTPFESKVGALADIANEGPIHVLIKKDGYFSQSYIVPNLFSGGLTIDANLNPDVPSSYKEINRIVSLAFEGERYVLQKRFDDALKNVDEIKKINPNIVVAFHLLGTINYLKNQYRESRFAWIRALELDPNDSEAKAMLELVEKKMGPDTPVTKGQ